MDGVTIAIIIWGVIFYILFGFLLSYSDVNPVYAFFWPILAVAKFLNLLLVQLPKEFIKILFGK